MEEIDVVATRHARARGTDPARDARLLRLRRGQYADAAAIDAASPRARYLARIEAVRRVRPNAIFALESALALHGLPFGSEPAYVFTMGDPSTPGSRAGIRHSHLPLPSTHRTAVDGAACSSIAWTLADVARRRVPSDSMPSIDAALRADLVDEGTIRAALARQSRSGRGRARWALGFADAASESVGESRSRVAIELLGFPRPALQVEVRTDLGVLRSDFGWVVGGRRLLGEFDGMVKYGELASAAGRTGAQALAAEKEREDRLRRHADVVRWTWTDVMRPERLERILRGCGLPQADRIRPPGVHLPF